MKVYIQSNKYQRFAAKISAYSFERFGIKTQLLDFDDNEILRKYIGQKYLRNGNLRTYKDDLQSFTLLRFLAPEINSSNEIILVIDPDVFALKNPYEMINLIDNYDIACTFKNNLPRSEVMLINNKNIKWEFEEICRMLFSKEIDYIDLINLNFDKK